MPSRLTRPAAPRSVEPVEPPARLRWPVEEHGHRPKLPQIRGGTPQEDAPTAELSLGSVESDPVEPEPRHQRAPEPVPTSPYAVAGIAHSPDTPAKPSYGAAKRQARALRTGLGIGIPVGALVVCGVVIAMFVSGSLGGGAAPANGPAAASSVSSAAPTPSPTPGAGLTSDPFAQSPHASASPGIGPTRLSADLFAPTWQLHYGEISLRAHRIKAQDYPGCKATLKPRVAQSGCRYAVLMTYRAEEGRLRMTQLVFDFGTTDAASKGADKLRADPNGARRPDGTQLPGSSQGWFKADDYGKYVVFTMVTAAAGVSKTTCQQFTTYGNTDLGAAILFRL